MPNSVGVSNKDLAKARASGTLLYAATITTMQEQAGMKGALIQQAEDAAKLCFGKHGYVVKAFDEVQAYQHDMKVLKWVFQKYEEPPSQHYMGYDLIDTTPVNTSFYTIDYAITTNYGMVTVSNSNGSVIKGVSG